MYRIYFSIAHVLLKKKIQTPFALLFCSFCFEMKPCPVIGVSVLRWYHYFFKSAVTSCFFLFSFFIFHMMLSLELLFSSLGINTLQIEGFSKRIFEISHLSIWKWRPKRRRQDTLAWRPPHYALQWRMWAAEVCLDVLFGEECSDLWVMIGWKACVWACDLWDDVQDSVPDLL